MIAPIPPDELPLDQRLERSRSLVDAPETVIERALQIFEPRARARPAGADAAAPRAGLVARLSAVLSFDTASIASAAPGLRSTAASTRQMLWSAEGRDIDLRIRPSAAGGATRWRISGQVLGPDRVGSARLSGPGRESEVPWSELAEFGFDDVTAGTWVIELRTQSWEMELPPIRVPDEG